MSGLGQEAPVAILEVDDDGRIVAANQGLAELLGRDGWLGLVGADALELVVPKDRARTEAWLRGLASTGSLPRDLDVDLVGEGEPISVEISASITRDGKGDPRSAVLVVHDVSVRRRAEEEVRRAHDYLADILNAVPSPIFVKDRQHRWIFCNAAFAELLGAPREVLLGRSDYDYVPKEQADVFWAKDDEVFATGAVNENEEVIEVAGRGPRILLTRKSSFRDDTGAEVLVAVIADVTERKLAEEAHRLATQVFEHSAQGILLTQPDHRVISVNRAFSRITGYSAGEVVGLDARILGASRRGAAWWDTVWGAVRELGSWEGEVANRSRDGQIYPAWLTVSAVHDDQGRLAKFVTLLADASERQAREGRLRWLAQHDVLTELPNRLLLMDRLRQAILQTQRSRARGAVLLLDLDRFKAINDAHGHQAGDRALCEAGRRMRAGVRASDTVARLGGDEFVVVLARVESCADAGEVAAKLVSALADPFDLGGSWVTLAASVGVAVFPDDGEDADALLAAADRAMYGVKAAGGGSARYAREFPPGRGPG